MSGRDGGDEPLDWKAFLADFHRARAGVAEAVLSRATAGDHSPYRWLGRAVSADAETIVDLAAGSGPMSRELARPGRTVVGVDVSEAELALAAERGPGPWVRADALRLPVRDGSVDVVTSSMGLVVVRPLDDLLAEVTRVLRPGGVLAAIAPAVRPLGPADLLTLGQISRRLRAKPRFPGPVELAGFHKALEAVGLTRVEDKRERYRFTIRTREDAELVMSALYLPTTRRSRVEAAVEYLEDRLERAESVEIAIPMRRVVAIK
ncbi:Methyltransferase domain-containing protein [Friedmanniella luteola]|uniref:Methyltransferase domain-containing protein n=1 Tax=Friedmanniella luteola TaxID=546871 RepID=A0A1H1MHN6_9ACTN|nr:class I SAM-dependent methyltransferase [Friedmanniella luteola]SDR86177.1 Methyltransferase domain-containing protein [Friedmanniella luteola]